MSDSRVTAYLFTGATLRPIPEEVHRHLNLCGYCGQPVSIMINRGTGVCSERCRKRLAWEDDFYE